MKTLTIGVLLTLVFVIASAQGRRIPQQNDNTVIVSGLHTEKQTFQQLQRFLLLQGFSIVNACETVGFITTGPKPLAPLRRHLTVNWLTLTLTIIKEEDNLIMYGNYTSGASFRGARSNLAGRAFFIPERSVSTESTHLAWDELTRIAWLMGSQVTYLQR